MPKSTYKYSGRLHSEMGTIESKGICIAIFKEFKPICTFPSNCFKSGIYKHWLLFIRTLVKTKNSICRASHGKTSKQQSYHANVTGPPEYPPASYPLPSTLDSVSREPRFLPSMDAPCRPQPSLCVGEQELSRMLSHFPNIIRVGCSSTGCLIALTDSGRHHLKVLK